MSYKIIGTRPIRHDGVDKVTGRALYGADFRGVSLLHGYILRSPYAHARILCINTSKAEAVVGVKAIITSQDFPQGLNRCTQVGKDEKTVRLRNNMLASHKVLYKGHAVAAVAAANAHLAEEAAALIEIEYEPLPAVSSLEEATRNDAPILHSNLKTKEFGEQTDDISNTTEHLQHLLGDVHEGFAEADIVIEREVHTATVHQGYIEPHNATALWNNDGRLHIWCSTQSPFGVRDTTARVLDIPVSAVKVTPMEIGGGFGGKIPVYLEPVAALLSKRAGRPVKIVMSRKCVFESTGPAPASKVMVRIGARRDGTLTAAQAHLTYEAGAFPGSMVGMGAICVFAAYDIPNVCIDAYEVVVNKPSTAPYRAPGATNATFATELVIDEIAKSLAMDPIELRLKNAAQEGTRRADGPKYGRVGCIQVLETMRRSDHYKSPLTKQHRGRGVAVGFWFNEGDPSSCTISVNSDGTVNLVEGSVDIGGTRTSIAMQAAEVLGIPAEHVHPTVADTDSIGFTAGTGGSRTTFATGWAAYEAAQDVIREMRTRLATLWQTKIEEVIFESGIFQCGSNSLSFEQVAARLHETGGPVIGRGSVNPRGVGGSFAGCIADVEVDAETGKVSLLRFTSVQDAGKAIHPSYVEGQMQGGSVQGIGWALNEEYCMSADGVMLNPTLLDYRIPTALDLPMIETSIVEVPNPGHPFGARGVGEASIVPPPAAIANAIFSAIGVRMDRLPMKPQAVMEALWRKSSSRRCFGV